MPCYDKKLEAAREDFVFQSDSINKTREENEAHKITEVDSVLTSGEVLELIQVQFCLMLCFFFFFVSMLISFGFSLAFFSSVLTILADERGGL